MNVSGRTVRGVLSGVDCEGWTVRGDRQRDIPEFCRPLLRLSAIALPYSFYSLLGFLGLSLVLLYHRGYRYLDPLTRGTLAVAVGLLLLSCGAANDRPEALLQLANFLPFFLLFVGLPALLRQVDLVRGLQRDLLLASLPISLITLVEYALKSPYLPALLQQRSWIEALRAAPHQGRPMVMFDHPNVLASYLVIVFGLGWGLLLGQWVVRRSGLGAAGALGLTLAAIACTGSRNGLAVAVLQSVIGLSLLRLPGLVKGGILVGVSGAGFGLAALSLGASRWRLAALLEDPRVGLWKIALNLVSERPWLGWGLGSFKQLYPARLIDPEYLSVFHPHNIGLLLAVEAGIGTAIALTVLVCFIAYRSWRSRPKVLPLSQSKAKPLSQDLTPAWVGSSLALLGVVGFACFDVTLYDGRVNALNWIVLASVYSATFWPLQPRL
ncbi:MAG: O-antigen ligase family protein [Elainellaceae cyanobacterium]